MYQTGYFGIPGKTGGQTHVVKDGKPICYYRPHKKAEFQFCAARIYLPYVECKRCKERAERVMVRAMKKSVKG